jgi:hypothetical protein
MVRCDIDQSIARKRVQTSENLAQIALEAGA